MEYLFGAVIGIVGTIVIFAMWIISVDDKECKDED